jgi:mRNA-degrading endonuclease toxin of MazEF toxin-antitoxin module
VGRRARERRTEGQVDGPFEGLVANLSQIVALDKTALTERAGRISRQQLQVVFAGLDIVVGR